METKLVLPVMDNVVGQVVRIQELQLGLSMSKVIAVQDKNGKTYSIWFNSEFANKADLNSILFVGNIVSVAFNRCIADTTYYYDEFSDEEIPHETTHLGGVDAFNAGEMVLTMLGFDNNFIKSIESKRTETSYHRTAVIENKSGNEYVENTIRKLEMKINDMTPEQKVLAAKRITELKKSLNKV